MDDLKAAGQEASREYNSQSDWHPADVQAALKKRGLSLASVSKANGYHATAAGKALKQSWPAMEILIAAAIGRPPGEIWPSRYASRPTVSISKNAELKKF
jgi:Ner family transcriptional regulator